MNYWIVKGQTVKSVKKFVIAAISFLIGCVGCTTISNKPKVLTTTSYSYDPSYIPYIVQLNGEEVGGGLGTATKPSAVIAGPQYIKWRETNSYKKHISKNVPYLTKEDLKGKTYLALHLYPDESVEITLSNQIPEATEKGLIWRSKLIDDLNTKAK